ncbi:MAG TPA: cation:proton antiporter [Candidatus Omnitrophota bacterium]|nr:cation:proton antiporter [Candidatus Omnitrophota bacterium]HPD84908.1 cation:proton antiporter [Candidatus Omnitrophota bacterium]HRZ03766.1 cation:proton antiporter [Candidatus Omnitrophota bacterium]
MKIVRWFIGAVALTAVVTLIIVRPMPFLFYPDLPHLEFMGRAMYIIILACLLCLYRVWKGPTGADRIVAVDILGIMIVGLCAILTISTGRMWYIDIGIAWALQGFISILALSKYLEGKGFDE